jgi:tetratricopeptide (TPR) repeat protein
MNPTQEFISLLEQIDLQLDQYSPGVLGPDRVVREIFEERAQQRPLLEKVVQMITEALERYPFNSELLRRRAYARSRIVTSDGEYPELELAENDLRTILKFDPNNLRAGAALLEDMFTYSGMEDADVAEIAEEFASRAEKLLLRFRALQIRACGYAGDHAKADAIYKKSLNIFPDSASLKSAKDDADSVKKA